MNVPGVRFAALVAFCSTLCSCSKQSEFRKETYPLTGQVFVDGQPAANLSVTLHDVKGMDVEHPTHSATFTDENGKFAVSTYEQADGVPAGEYVVTFMWGQLNVFSMQYGGPDKLKDKYNDPATSQTRVKVEEGKPTDLGRIDLTTK